MKFKLGDKVRAIKNDYLLTNQKSKWEGIVTNIGTDVFCAKTTNSIRSFEIGCEYHGLTYEDFELISSSKEKEDVKEMTLEEVCKELGYEIKIVKEKK